MQLYELEISNYKCLDFYGMPLRFGNLNLFIGENDAGKTALLETIQIMFGKGDIGINDFYDKTKKIRIKARLCNLDPQILKNVMDHVYETGSETEVKTFEEIIETIKSYSFYSDLIKFYKFYLKNYTIILEQFFCITEDKVETRREIYFSNPLSSNEFLNNLLNNEEFINFMNNSFRRINNNIASYKERNDNSGYSEYLNSLENLKSYPVIKGIDNKNLNNFLMSSALDPIAYRIGKIINKRTYNNCNWDFDYDFLEATPFKYNQFGIKNSDFYSEGGRAFFNSDVIYFGTAELNGETLSKRIYDDLYRFVLKIPSEEKNVLLKEINDHLNNTFKNFMTEKISGSLDVREDSYRKDFYNAFNEDLNSLAKKLTYGDINLKINFKLRRFDEIEELLEPTLKISVFEGDREIDISNKSQGFLRKLLICDFLALTEIMGSSNDNGRILLIEEPEIHMHIKAQKQIINILRENLLKSDTQVFITTHSQKMIDENELENVYVFNKDILTGLSDIYNLKQIQVFAEEDIFDKLRLSLGVRNTDLLFLKKLILITEGRNDIAFIKGLCKRNEFNIDTNQILFIEASGQANIKYYLGLGDFLGIKTLVIYDQHDLNVKDKKRFIKNSFISEKLKEKIIKIIILNKSDILNYLDYKKVAEYLNISLNIKDQSNLKINLKDILSKYNKKLFSDSIEHLANTMPKVDKELIDKIINILNLLSAS